MYVLTLSSIHTHGSHQKMGTLHKQQSIREMDEPEGQNGDLVTSDDIGYDMVDMGLMTKQASCDTDIGENHFDTRRNFVHSLLDVALLLANVSQLKTLLHSGNAHAYFAFTLTLICMSISLQVIIAILMIFMWSVERQANDQQQRGDCTTCVSMKAAQSTYRSCSQESSKQAYSRQQKWNAACIDRLVLLLIMCVILVNIFITGLGIVDTNKC